MKKIISVIVLMVLLGFSQIYAYDAYYVIRGETQIHHSVAKMDDEFCNELFTLENNNRLHLMKEGEYLIELKAFTEKDGKEVDVVFILRDNEWLQYKNYKSIVVHLFQ